MTAIPTIQCRTIVVLLNDFCFTILSSKLSLFRQIFLISFTVVHSLDSLQRLRQEVVSARYSPRIPSEMQDSMLLQTVVCNRLRLPP
jgi:hypothetical protein